MRLGGTGAGQNRRATVPMIELRVRSKNSPGNVVAQWDFAPRHLPRPQHPQHVNGDRCGVHPGSTIHALGAQADLVNETGSKATKAQTRRYLERRRGDCLGRSDVVWAGDSPAYSPRNGRISIRVRLGTLYELEYGDAGIAPRLKFLPADIATKAARIPEETFSLRALIDGPALARDRLHRPNMHRVKSQF